MNAYFVSLIITWCAGIKHQGLPIINEPLPEMQCRQMLISCVENNKNETQDYILSKCLDKTLNP